MGASESKLAFKKGVFRLFEEEDIPSSENEYWDSFFTIPESIQDIFDMVSLDDLRKAHPRNIQTLISKLGERILDFSCNDDLPKQKQIDTVNNCLRILIRLMPYVYENPQFEFEVFWSVHVDTASRKNHPELRHEAQTPDAFRSPEPSNETLAPLAERLIRALLNMMFMPGYTLPTNAQTTDARIDYIVWQTGIGASRSPDSPQFCIENRVEVLRCLLVLFSKSIYLKPSETLVIKNPWLNYFSTKLEKQAVLAVLCSLLNTIINYNPVGWVPYNYVIFSDPLETVVLLSAEVLSVLLSYTIDNKAAEFSPEAIGDSDEQSTGSRNHIKRPSVYNILPTSVINEGEREGQNQFQYFLSKLHRIPDFQIIFNGLSVMLKNPLQYNNTYLPYSMKQVTFTEEILMIFWKILEYNQSFFQFVCQSEAILEVTAGLLYQALEMKNNQSKVGYLRLCTFIIHLLSGERGFAVLLNSPCNFAPPSAFEVPAFKGSYADLLILSIYTLIFTTQGNLSSLYDCLLTIIANISPYTKSLCQETSKKLLTMFITFSNPIFLLAKDANHILVFYLLDTFNNILQYQFDGNSHLVYEILRCKEQFTRLRDLDYETAESMSMHTKQKRKAKQDAAEGKTGPNPIDTFLREQGEQDVPNGEASVSKDAEAVEPIVDKIVKLDLEKEFVPTKQWFNFWHSQLPLNTITALLENLGFKIEQLCEENNWNDDKVLDYLKNATLVGLLPVPHPIFVRKFQFTSSIYIWFSSYMWGVVYLRHTTPSPAIWIGSHAKLFMVRNIESSAPIQA